MLLVYYLLLLVSIKPSSLKPVGFLLKYYLYLTVFNPCGLYVPLIMSYSPSLEKFDHKYKYREGCDVLSDIIPLIFNIYKKEQLT